MSDHDIEQSAAGDEDLFEGLHRSVAGVAMTTSVTDVVALGRRTRNRHRALAAGIGTSAVAVVAAVGMLAPSAGSGGGSAPGTAASGTTSGGVRTLSIQDAGFSLEAKADGTVELDFQDFDPGKLQAALDRAGIPADIQRTAIPDHGNNLMPSCKPTPGVTLDTAATQEVIKQQKPNGGGKVVFNAAKFPAGDVVSLSLFDFPNDRHVNAFSILTGKPQKCVPVLTRAVAPRHK